MIQRVLLFALILCLAAPPAQAGLWFFNSKKKEAPATGEQPAPPKVFNNPAEIEGMPEKKWALDKVLNNTQSNKSPDVVINGVTIKGLTQEMLGASYAPKSVEEIGAIMHAQNAWQDQALAQLEAEAQARIAIANKKSAEGLKALAGASEEPKHKGQDVAPEPEKPPVKEIFNKPSLPEPGKVFTGYR